VVNRFHVPLAIALVPASLVAQASRPAATTDVPVTRVVLFSSGVGYFEHAGTVHGNSATELRFRASQINDILKSIVLQDQDGGRVGAITYPSQDPLAKTLRSFQVDITRNPSLADLLNQLRGAKVTVQAQAERLAGTILGVETRRRPTERGEGADVAVLNLMAGPVIRSVELPSISSLALDDPQLQEELAKALAALAQARDQDKKPVTITFTGAGDRHVRVGYVVETPVWKASYRLVLGDKNAGAKLQGWAIVENQTESDWNNVSLSLVSGRPISFMMDLYQPLYATRPTVVPEMYANLHPQVYAGGTDTTRERVAMQTAGGVAAQPRRIGYGPDGTPAAVQLSEIVATAARVAASGRIDATNSVQAAASAARMGELFQYTVGDVTLPRQKSAMLPIITDTVSAERLSIYNAAVLATNPLNGVLLRNSTGKALLQGPLTVLDEGGYAGDARIDDVPAGQDRLLSYGIDLDMTVDNTKNVESGSLLTARINKGTLIVDRKLVSSREYAADNKTGRTKTLVIEHPIRFGWKLVDTPKPFETTPAVYRFKGTAPGGKVTTLVVKEEYIQSQAMTMLNADLQWLTAQSRAVEIPKSVRDAIAKAIQLRQAVMDVEAQIGARNQRIAEISGEQTRIRENMKIVGQNTQYYERLLAKLNEQESSIEGFQRERDALSVRRDSLTNELRGYLNGLTVG